MERCVSGGGPVKIRGRKTLIRVRIAPRILPNGPRRVNHDACCMIVLPFSAMRLCYIVLACALLSDARCIHQPTSAPRMQVIGPMIKAKPKKTSCVKKNR